MFRPSHYITITIITGILAILAGFWDFATLGTALGVIFLSLLSCQYGKKLFFDSTKVIQAVLGFFVVICLIMIIGTLFFYFYALNYLFIFIIVLILPLILREKKSITLLLRIAKLRVNLFSRITDIINKKTIILKIVMLFYLVLFTIILYILKTNSTTTSLRSLWHIIPSYFFIIYFLATLVLLLIIFHKRQFEKIDFRLWLIIAHLFITSSLLFFIFKLGYGFDPFIHQATMKIILETGTITPKPFYYIGQYSLEFFFVKFLNLNINWLDQVLVIFLSALLLPTTFYYSLSKKITNKINLHLIILSFFIFLPLGFTTLTTPQNLANLFIIILIVLSYGFICHSDPPAGGRRIFSEYQNLVDTRSFVRQLTDQDDSFLFNNLLLLLISLTIFTIHPLSGIPAFIFLFLFYFWNKFQTTNKKIFINIFIILSILSAISLPLIWLINGQISSQAIVSINHNYTSEIKNYLKDFELINFKYQGQYKPILSLIYFIYFNIKIIFTIIVFGTIYKLFRQKKLKTLTPYLITFLILVINYFLLKFFLVFDFLIAYEKNSYADRVLQIGLFFLLSIFVIFFETIWQKILSQKKNFLFIILILFPIILTTSFYLTYPRHDNYSASGGFSVSQSDITAVNYINENASDNFVVLANQQTSVVALHKFGFKKYFQTEKGEIFYYPIPTGGPLYQYYLQMVNTKPSREIMDQAMDLVGVKEGYFVINKYWWNFGKIVEQAKSIADSFETIDNGEIVIFKFIR